MICYLTGISIFYAASPDVILPKLFLVFFNVTGDLFFHLFCCLFFGLTLRRDYSTSKGWEAIEREREREREREVVRAIS